MSEPLHNFNQVPQIGAHTVTSNPIEILDRYDDFYHLGNALIEYKETQDPAKLRGELLALFAIDLVCVASDIPEKVMLNLFADLVEIGASNSEKAFEVQGLLCLVLDKISNKMPGFVDNIIGQANGMMAELEETLGIVSRDEALHMTPDEKHGDAYSHGLKRVDKFLMITDGMTEFDSVAMPSEERFELARKLFGFNQLFTFAIGAISQGTKHKVSACISSKPHFMPV